MCESSAFPDPLRTNAPPFGSETPADFFLLLDSKDQERIICLIRALLSKKSHNSSAQDPVAQTND
jgi:hypothetical protein